MPGYRILIDGVGLVTPLGHAAWPTFRALLAGRRITDRAQAEGVPPDVAPLDLVRLVGGVSIAQHSSIDPAVELAERAAREAADEAGVALKGLPMFLGSSKGAVVALARAAQRRASGEAMGESERLAVALGPHGLLSQSLRKRLGVVPMGHAVAACASSLTALHRAARWLNPPPPMTPPAADAVVVLTAEAALLPLFVVSYTRLGVLAPLTPGGYQQRPLSSRREGFVLAQAGAAVLLRRVADEPTLPTRPRPIELAATATACEATDLIRPDPHMAALRHIACQLFEVATPDVIHPHAPGTPEHDPAELAALADVLGYDAATRTTVYAGKGALGHALGAAGLVSLVLAVLMLRSGRRPAMGWLESEGAMDESPFPLDPRAMTLDRSGTHAVFAAGFGGHVAGALIA